MLWIGTSGYSYPEWKGSFYPAALPQAKMFAYYAERFRTVEINNTFYRMPDEKLVTGWAAAGPEGFLFTLKVPQRITHLSKLRNCADTVAFFLGRARLLGPKLGVLLFQLPPTLKKDTALLGDVLDLLPAGTRAAFEFRHASWHDDGVFDRLRASDVALCIADSEKMTTPTVATASYGYLRLRDEGYERADIARWWEVIQERASGWKDTFVYFKHEKAGKGPELAKMLMELAGGAAAV
jgi:uncharacterized protein YecE (DUF72 family)